MGTPADRMYDALREQADVVRSAARALHAVVERASEHEKSLGVAALLDDQASSARERLERSVVGSLRAPIDRDDLYGLSCELDGARQVLTRTVRRIVPIRRPSAGVSPAKASELLVDGAELIYGAIGDLRLRAFDAVVGAGSRLRTARRDARTLSYDALLGVLDTGETSHRALVEAKAALDRIDGVAARLAAVGSRLAYVGTKNQ